MHTNKVNKKGALSFSLSILLLNAVATVNAHENPPLADKPPHDCSYCRANWKKMKEAQQAQEPNTVAEQEGTVDKDISKKENETADGNNKDKSDKDADKS